MAAQMYPVVGRYGMVPAGNVGYGPAKGMQVRQGGSAIGGNFVQRAPPQSTSARSPMGFAAPAPDVQYGYWHDRGEVQLQAPMQQALAPTQMRLGPDVLAKVKEHLEQNNQHVVCLAPNHAAARLLPDGDTIHHSAGKFALRGSFKGCILLDEISMCGLGLLAALDQLRLNGTKICTLRDWRVASTPGKQFLAWIPCLHHRF